MVRRLIAKILVFTCLFTFCSFYELTAATLSNDNKEPKVKETFVEVIEDVNFTHITYDDGSREVIADYGNGKKDIAKYSPKTEKLTLNGKDLKYKHTKKNEKLNDEEFNPASNSILATTSHTWRYECTEYHTYYWQGLTVGAATIAAAALMGISATIAKSQIVGPYTRYVFGVAIPTLAYVIATAAPDYNTKAIVYYDVYDEYYHWYHQTCYVRTYCIADQWYETYSHPYE